MAFHLARDLARSVSKTGERGLSDAAGMAGFTTASQPIVSKLDAYALRAESAAVSLNAKTPKRPD